MSHNAKDSGAYDAEDGLQIVWTSDGHPDEGSLLALVDAAFDAETADEAQSHVDRCAVCQDHVAALRGYGAAASRILGALDRTPVHGTSRPEDQRVTVPVVGSTGRNLAGSRAARSTRTWLSRRLVGVAAAAVLIVAGATWSLRDRPEVFQVATGTSVVPAPSVDAPSVAERASGAAPHRAMGASVPNSSGSAKSSRVDTFAVVQGMAKRTTAGGVSHVADAASDAAATAPSTLSAAGSQERSRVAAAAKSNVGASPEMSAPSPASAPALNERSRAVAVARSIVVRGTVRAADTQRPIEAASVLALRQTATTDSAGRYSLRLAGIERGDSVRVSIRRLGYIATTITRVVDGDTLTIDAALPVSVTSLSSVVIAADQAVTRREMVFSSATVAAAPNAKGAMDARPRNRNAAVMHARRGQEPDRAGDREQYDRIDDNPFLAVKGNPRSTFSIDVDRASYGNVRRFINEGRTPPPDAVRIEELVNYFPYDLPQPKGDVPISITTESMAAPWQPKHRLVRIALQARRIETEALPASNLVFLIDVSGSMNSPDKLPLVKQSLRLLVDQLRAQDRVALVVYAGAAGLVLPSTSGEEKATIAAAIDRLEAGGSTAGGAGIELAYKTAKEHFLARGNNRVILATDGDFNVGASSDAAMERLIEAKRAEGTYLTILGFGTGNYQDAKMEKLSKRGNGNFAYVDNIAEARKVLVKEMSGTLVTVANDVKVQVEFNPSMVRAYRLIGYEDRLLSTEDFADDRKDAGDIGAGHSVTALYEIVPSDVKGTVPVREQDALRYEIPPRDRQRPRATKNELMYVSMRYKTPGDSTSKLVGQPVLERGEQPVSETASSDLRFAASVASFGMLLRNSEYKGSATMPGVLEMARSAKGKDAGGYRAEFIGLVEKLTKCMSGEKPLCAAPSKSR